MSKYKKPKIRPIRPLYLLFALIIIAALGYFGYTFFFKKSSTDSAQDESPGEDSTEQPDEEDDENQTTIILDETPAYDGAHFFEKTPEIEGEQAYIALPLEIDLGNPPKIIVYSHGSNTTITTDFSGEFMQQMQDYSEFFTQNNYIFAASSMHGANWGSDEAIQDMKNLVDWTKQKYSTSEKINLLGFSMGGLPTFNFAFAYPALVDNLASLAGTTRTTSWGETNITKLQSINVKIWHGDADVNVAYKYSENFVDYCEQYGIEIELRTIEGVGHYDIDWEYHEEILEFFNN